MTRSFKLAAAAIAVVLTLPSVSIASPGWSAHFDRSLEDAVKHDKNLLIDFTGSDWCSWCIKLRKEVFAHEEFDAGVKDKFVLVELDYPKDQSILSEQILKQNARLLEQYPITGYPTVLLCDSAGKPFAATGYQPGGPAAYLPHLDELLAKKSARDKSLAKARSQSGVEKAKTLIAALNELGLSDSMVAKNYDGVIAEICAADPADETGFKKKSQVDGRFAKFMKDLGELRSKSDLEGVGKLVKTTLADPLIQGETRQQVHGHHAGTLASAGKKDEAIEVLRKAVAEDPEGARTTELRDFIGILEREKSGLPPVPKKPTE